MVTLLNRSMLATCAAGLAALATVVTSRDGDHDFVPFFVGLTLAGGVGAWAVHEPYVGARRAIARLIALAWVGAAVLIGGLLIWYQALCACSSPVPPPEETYLGLTATAYRLVALFVGTALMVVAAFSRALKPTATPGGAPAGAARGRSPS
jgi:hypothetical protein